MYFACEIDMNLGGRGGRINYSKQDDDSPNMSIS
jgi:hypothetical protein